MGDGEPHHLLGVPELSDESALPPVTFKRLPREPLAGGRPKETGEKLWRLGLPVAKHRGGDIRHSRRVRIGFGSHIQPVRMRAVQHAQRVGKD